MQRWDFLKKCGMGCLGIYSFGLALVGCSGTKYVTGKIDGSFLIIPKNQFIKADGNYLRYIIAHNDALKYPLLVFRFQSNDFKAMLMKCTHQGAELQIFGDRLQCPAHGSEFTNQGELQSGPADKNLTSFPVILELDKVKIDLS